MAIEANNWWASYDQITTIPIRPVDWMSSKQDGLQIEWVVALQLSFGFGGSQCCLAFRGELNLRSAPQRNPPTLLAIAMVAAPCRGQPCPIDSSLHFSTGIRFLGD